MKAVREDLIRLRAYEIWEQRGRPDGHDKEHWEEAERELLDAAPGIKASTSAASLARSQPVEAASEPMVRQTPDLPKGHVEGTRAR